MVSTRVLLVRQQRPHALNCTDDESPGTPDLASTGHGQEHNIQIREEDSQNSYIVHPFTQENSTLLEQRWVCKTDLGEAFIVKFALFVCCCSFFFL